VPLRRADAEASIPGRPAFDFSLLGIDAGVRRPWTLTSGRDLGSDAPGAAPALLVNRLLATALKVSLGDTIAIRVVCAANRTALAPATFRITGIADFPFDDETQSSAVASRKSVTAACGNDGDDADMLLIASREGYGADAAVSAIRRRRPDLHPATNEEIVTRMQQTGFTYFRQISTVLSTITLLFGFLLTTVLLTVSVNQRLAEIAAIRALGFSRSRVAADVLCQSALLVGSGGVLALPLGFALSIWLDRILKAMPGIPAALHFFVFEPRALLLHAALLGVTAVLAALYPMRLVATLPIAATLRNEIVS
jgi:putative ABC transport system permease protein